MRRALRAIALCALLSGCYTYTPLDSAGVMPGLSVRARLSAPAAARIAPSLGNGDARVLTGVVTDALTDALTLEIPTVPAGTATAQQGLFQRVTFARSDILEFEGRTLDRQRTGTVIVAAIAGAGVITAAIIHGQSSGSSAQTEPASNFLRRLAISFRF
jgi:hypothetical protein